jgi:hypothetical protein
VKRLNTEFAEIEKVLYQLRSGLRAPPTQDLRTRRLLRLDESIADLRIAWERYESDFAGYSQSWEEISGRVKWAEGSSQPLPLSSIERTVLQGFIWTGPLLAFDIRCIYIFAKISFVAFMGLVKTISRAANPALLVDFENTHQRDIDWFRAHVSNYRNEFVEHPSSPSPLAGLSWSPETGAKIAGFKVSPNEEDRKWLDLLGKQMGQEFPQDGDHYNMHRYEWLCQNLHRIPQEHTERAKQLVLRVGTDSGDIEGITRQSVTMLTRFAVFCMERMKNQP